MENHHPLPNKSQRYRWTTDEVTTYQIPLDEKHYQEKLDRVAEALYILMYQLSERESFDSLKFNLSDTHQGSELPNSNQGTSTSSPLERALAHEQIIKKAA